MIAPNCWGMRATSDSHDVSRSDESDWGSVSRMADDDAQYDFKDVRAIRGTEARSIAKWQKDGWELVTRTRGRCGRR